MEEMWQLRDDVKASQEEAALQVARSSRCDPYTFKRKGNENQHAFNGNVEDKLVQAQAHLGKVEAGEEGNTCSDVHDQCFHFFKRLLAFCRPLPCGVFLQQRM